MESTPLSKLTTTLNQGTVDEIPKKLSELWVALTESEPDNTHASEKFILRWLLKSMTGSSADAETVRRYPLTWTLMRCLFSRIPLFSLAKALADRRFIAILQQTLKNIASPSDSKGPDGDIEMQDAPSNGRKSLKRKRSQELAFDLSALKTPSSRLQSIDQVFAAVRALLYRIPPDANDKANDRMGAEHIHSLFGCAIKDALQMMSASLDICKLAIAEESSEALEGQEFWINTFASVWDLHMRSGSDARDFALHIAGSSCLVLGNLINMDHSSSTLNKRVVMTWTRDLQGLITKNLILPARSEFFLKTGTGIISAPITQHADASAICPVLFQLVLQAPKPIGGSTMKKDTEEWIDAVFGLMEKSLQALATEQRKFVMQKLLAMALDQNSSPKTSTLLNVCRQYVVGDGNLDWVMLSSVSRCDPDVFLTSDEGRSLLDTVLDEAPNGIVEDKDIYEALCSTMLSMASGFVTARELFKFVKKWFQRLTNCSIQKNTTTTEGIFWLDTRISQSVSGYIQEALTAKQLADLISDLSQPNDTPAEAARAVVFDAICQGITIDEIWEAVGTSLFQSVWTSPTKFKAAEVASAQRRIAAKAFGWGVAKDAWEMTGTFLQASLDQPKLKAPETFEAFRSTVAAWKSCYSGEVVSPQDSLTLTPEALISVFMKILNGKLLTEELHCDDSIMRLRLENHDNIKESDVFNFMPLGHISATTYLAWILFYCPKMLQMLQSIDGLADFVKAVINFLSRTNESDTSSLRQAFDTLATALTDSLADIPGDSLSTNFVGPVIEMLESASSFSQLPRPGVAATRLLTSVSSEQLQRCDRERLMKAAYTIATSPSCSEFDGFSWESLLGLMVQLMAKPTFYAEMSIQGLLQIGKLLKKRVRKDKAESFKDSRTAIAFKLYGELSYLIFRQMSISTGARETNFLKQVWPLISKVLGKKSRDTAYMVPLTLLTAFVVALEQSPVQTQLSQEVHTLKEAKEELPRLTVVAIAEHFKGTDVVLELNLETLTKLRAAFMAAEVCWSSSSHEAIMPMHEQIIRAVPEIRKADVEIGTLITSFIVGRLQHGQRDSTSQVANWNSQDPSEIDISKVDVTSVIKSIDMTVLDDDDSTKAARLRELASGLHNASDRAIRLLIARGLVRTGIQVSSPTDESAIALSMVQNTLTQLLVSAKSINEFVDGVRTIHPLLETKSVSVTQWNVEHTLSSIAAVCSDRAVNTELIRSSPKMFEWLCLMMEVILKRHRLRLKGHFHLLVTVLQSLLTCLILHPYDISRGSWASGSTADRKKDNFPYWERHAKAYNRLLTLVCEPTAASVMRTHKYGSSAPLDSATDAAKRAAGQYMYLVLMHFIQLQLESDIPHSVREALVPGMNSIVNVTPHDMRKVMNDAMDASGRAIFKDIYEKYRRFSKWMGA